MDLRHSGVVPALTLFALWTGAFATAAPVHAAATTPAPQPSPGCPQPPLHRNWRPSPHDLARILARHAGWIASRGGAVLDTFAPYFQEKYPSFTSWRKEAEQCAEQANLSGAYLAGLDLSGADFSGPGIMGGQFIGTNLVNANLSSANLSFADMHNAFLNNADLHATRLYRTNLENTRLTSADMTGALYAPASLPPYPFVAGIQGIDTLRSEPGEEVGLVQLRKLLADAGLRDEERAATYAIERAVTNDRLRNPATWAEGVGSVLAFDATTAYGLHPGRALLIIVVLGILLVPVYVYAILHPTPTSGIVQIFAKDRVDGTAAGEGHGAPRETRVVSAPAVRKAIPSALYFSLISAVNIGFEQFTPGDWISRLQARDYSLQAVGWVRVVAGAQALLSVFLLAMWALTQFGRPFD